LYCYTKEAAEFRRVAEMAAAAEEAEADDASGRATACDSTYDPTTAAPAADKSEGKQEQKINEAVGPSSSSAADAKEGDELTAVEAAAEAAAAARAVAIALKAKKQQLQQPPQPPQQPPPPLPPSREQLIAVALASMVGLHIVNPVDP
jgi:hypothetical protein